MANVLESIPGLGGYLAMQDYRQRQALGDMQGVVGLLGAVRQQQEAERESALAPLKQQLFQAQVQQAQLQMQDAQRKRDFFTPTNLQQFMSPGAPEIPAPSVELGGGPGKPAEAPRMDFDRLLSAGVANGVLNPETMINRQMQLEDKRIAREQRMQELQSRIAEARTTAQERMQFQRELAQMQIDARREQAQMNYSLRQQLAQQGGRPPAGYQYKPDGTLEPIPGGPGDKKQERNDTAVQHLRKEFNALPEVKNYRTVVPIIQSIKGAKDTPAGDLDFIYAVGKILDPDSVVREGEMNLVIKSGGPMERFKGAVNNVMGGARLTPTIRANLLQMLNSRVGELRRGYDAAESMYRRNADRRQLPTDEIFMDYGDTNLPAAPAGEKPAGEWSIRKKN